MKNILIFVALMGFSNFTFGNTNCTGHVLNLKTNAHAKKPLLLNAQGLYRAEIQGFIFGASMNPSSNISPGGGVYNKDLGINIFTQADRDNTGILDTFYQSSEVLGYRLTLDCTPTK